MIATMRIRRWCWVYVLVAVPFAGTVQAQSPDSGTTPIPTSRGVASSLAISMADTVGGGQLRLREFFLNNIGKRGRQQLKRSNSRRRVSCDQWYDFALLN